MGICRYVFEENWTGKGFKTTLNFEQLSRILSRSIGAKYKLGVIGKHEIRLYYHNSFKYFKGDDWIPWCEFKAKKDMKKNKGQAVKFKIALHSIFVAMSLPVFITIMSLLGGSVPFVIQLIFTGLSTGLLYQIFQSQCSKFERDLKSLEDSILS